MPCVKFVNFSFKMVLWIIEIMWLSLLMLFLTGVVWDTCSVERQFKL